jgi:hypothetical protein
MYTNSISEEKEEKEELRGVEKKEKNELKEQIHMKVSTKFEINPH